MFVTVNLYNRVTLCSNHLPIVAAINVGLEDDHIIEAQLVSVTHDYHMPDRTWKLCMHGPMIYLHYHGYLQKYYLFYKTENLL
jgi:hypothetical protein